MNAIPVRTTNNEPGTPLTKKYIEAMSLTKNMKSAIERYDKGFKQWDINDFSDKQTKNYPFSEKALPYAIKGDYNADGTEDIIISGRNQEGNLSLALLASGTGYNIIAVASGDANYTRAAEQQKTLQYTPACILIHQSKGAELDTTSDSASERSSKILNKDGFIVEYTGDLWPNLSEWDDSKLRFVLYGVNCETYDCLK
jgi:hypothetical protein